MGSSRKAKGRVRTELRELFISRPPTPPANSSSVLIRLARSGKNVDQRKVHRIVSASNSIGGAFYKAMYAKSGEKKKGGPKGDPGSSVRHKDGDQVGEGAERIGMDNIGHRLLSKMG